MHDIRLIRENAAAFDDGLRARGLDAEASRLIALDDRRKSAVSALQQALERRNALSKEIGQAKARKDEARAQELMADVARLKESVPLLEQAEREAEKELDEALAGLPNVPKDDVPVGPDETANVERHRFGQPKGRPGARQHFEIGEAAVVVIGTHLEPVGPIHVAGASQSALCGARRPRVRHLGRCSGEGRGGRRSGRGDRRIPPRPSGRRGGAAGRGSRRGSGIAGH